MSISPGLSGEIPTPTTQQNTRQRIQEKRQRPPRKPGWFAHSLLLLLLLACGALGTLAAFEQRFATRIYPNVSIQGIAVGQKSQAEAVAALHEHFAAFIDNPVTIAAGGRSWQPTAADLGLTLHIDEAAAQALATGRHSERLEMLRSAAAISMYGWEIPLHLSIDHQQMQQYLLQRLPDIEHPPIDGHLLLDGTWHEVTSAALGQQVLIDATMQDITAAVQTLEARTVPVRTRPLQPLLDDASVAAARQQVATLLQSPLTLVAGERQWVWQPEDLAPLVHVDRIPADEGDQLVVSLNEKLIRQHLLWFAEITEEKGVYPRVDWNGGNPVIFRQGSPGAKIDVAQAVPLVSKALWSPDAERSVQLPFQEVPVPNTPADIAQLGLNERISVGRTSFEDSQDYRVTNIVAGMNLLHGILLAPGDEFSFNEAIGSIDQSHGFVQGYAIVDERTQLEWGGGICQDSTTMLRAAFWAGLPITERWNHSRYISWYDDFGYGEYGDGPGIDATIFLGGPDLKFVNDTDAWILIQAYANPTSEIAEIHFYGTRGGRSVEFGGRKISYRENGTMDVAFTRIIKQDGVEVYRKTYWSSFEPW